MLKITKYKKIRVKIEVIRVMSSIMIRMRSNSSREVNIGYVAIGFCPKLASLTDKGTLFS